MIINTLYANEKDELFDEPGLQMLARSGMEWVSPEPDEMIPLPKGASLVRIPTHRAVGLDTRGQAKLAPQNADEQREYWAVAALLPQGFTRTLFPATVAIDPAYRLPLLGYTAVGLYEGEIYVAALQTDEHRKWHPKNYNTSGLDSRIKKMLLKYPQNRIYSHLSHCAQNNSCFTAQNVFYQRWEGGIPSINACNANCIGCISEDHMGISPPQDRLSFTPTIKEITEVGIEHLSNASEAIISFGQGCEGDPALNFRVLSPAIEAMRLATAKGMINMNTNAGCLEGIAALFSAGLDSIRVSIFSCQPDNYNKYHKPHNYSLNDVVKSIKLAKDKGGFVSLNLLTLPGFTDLESEIESLLDFVSWHQIDMIQFRNLNIDLDYLAREIEMKSSGMGIKNLIKILSEELPEVRLGSYTPALR